MISEYASYETRRIVQANVDALKKGKETAFDSIKKKDAYEKRLAQEQAHLDKITPPDITGDQRPRLEKRLHQLEEAWVGGVNGKCPPAPSVRQMEQSPTGAVGQHQTHERFMKDYTLDPNGKPVRIDRTKQKGITWEIKDLKRVLGKEREYDDPDVANLASLRRDTDVPLADTRLPRSYGLTPAARENFDAVFPDREPLPVEKKLYAEPDPAPAPKLLTRKETPIDRQCGATKKDGEKCKTPMVGETGRCVFHQPAKVQAGEPKKEGAE